MLLPVGRVARAHGVRGRILLVPYNDESQDLVSIASLWLKAPEGEPRRFEVERAERANLGYLVALLGVEDRDAAAALRGQEALVDRAELPVPGDDELYAADLIGMSAVDQSGTERGQVVAIESAGPQELLRVRHGEKESLVPLSLVVSIDEEARKIAIDAPEGLFDLEG
ncbi:MAG: ribosome maturation factor RimM [Myxococcales bacterium]